MNSRKILYQFGYRRNADQDRSSPARHPVDRRRCGSGRALHRHRSGAARRAGGAARRCRPDRRGLARHLLCQAHARNPRPARRCARTCVEKGVTWKLGKVFQRDELLYAFDLLPEDGHKMPAFINLQQYYLEKALVERAAELPNLDLRWRNRVSGLKRRNDGVTLTIETPDGSYELDADWVIAADGARSSVARNARARLQGRGLRGQLPHRRCEDGGRFSDRAAGSGSIRRSMTAARR